MLFLLYINDLPKTISDTAIPLLFADYTNILITSPNTNDFWINKNTASNCVNEWLKVNLLSTNFDKTHYIQFTTNNKPITDIKIVYDNKQITAIPSIKFLGLYAKDTVNWTGHIEHISSTYIQTVKQKIVIIGDSHARKSAAELKHNIGLTFTVSSFIKPGAGMGSIVDTIKEDIKTLKKDDVVIIWGGQMILVKIIPKRL